MNYNYIRRNISYYATLNNTEMQCLRLYINELKKNMFGVTTDPLLSRRANEKGMDD